jgi:HAD superfamily hydrolase (TIGR01509 family)
MPEVLLTDIDGTLVDSNALHAEAWRRAFEHFDIQAGLDDTWRQIGKGGDQLIPAFVKDADRDRLKKPIEAFRKEVFHRDYMPRVVCFQGSRQLLLKVRERGMRIVLATSASEEDIKTYKRIVGMEELIEDAASSADARQSKPAPDIFAAALAKAGSRPDEAIALGDTPYDAQAAGKLGIPVIGLTCGGWKREDLLSAGCVAVYHDPADLLQSFHHSMLAK